jgi:hypothetical protein
MHYVALLHFSGCTSDGHQAAQLYGDDIVLAFASVAVPRGESAVMYSAKSGTHGGDFTDTDLE